MWEKKHIFGKWRKWPRSSEIQLETVVGVNLGEIEIFALSRSSFIFTPYTCKGLRYAGNDLEIWKWLDIYIYGTALMYLRNSISMLQVT